MADSQDPPVPPEFSVRREVWLAVAFTAALLAGVALAGHYFREDVVRVTDAVYRQLGFRGIATVFFITETLVAPLPSDVVLMVVAGSGELGAHWHIPVAILGLLSTVGGNLAWLLGRGLANTGLVRRMLGRHHGGIVRLTRQYGIWAVILAALTPLPWSVAGWTAGALHLPWRRYFLGSLVRAPRTFIVYALIRLAFEAA